MIHKTFILSLLVLVATTIASVIAPAIASVHVRELEGIVAIVNDEVISLYDVDQRVTLTIATSGITRTPEATERIRAQVLRSLIDEKLQLQEAERVEIKIDEKEIDKNIEQLAQENDMTNDGIKTFLKENAINKEVLRGQVRAEIAWQQFVRRSFGGRVVVGETEIDEQFDRTMQTINQPRYQVSEILLGADSFSDEQRIKELSTEIIRQLRSGVDFAAVARQFSISPSAARGGQLGWVGAAQLNSALANALVQLQPGQISPPIRTNAGVYILALFDRRIGTQSDTMQDRLDVLSVRYPEDADSDKISALSRNFSTCRAAEAQAKSDGAKTNRSGLVPLGQVPPPLREGLMTLEAGEITPPRKHDKGTDILIVCDRKDDQGIQVSRDDIADNIYSQRVSMLARRHLRDLRRDAVVEYR